MMLLKQQAQVIVIMDDIVAMAIGRWCWTVVGPGRRPKQLLIPFQRLAGSEGSAINHHGIQGNVTIQVHGTETLV